MINDTLTNSSLNVFYNWQDYLAPQLPVEYQPNAAHAERGEHNLKGAPPQSPTLSINPEDWYFVSSNYAPSRPNLAPRGGIGLTGERVAAPRAATRSALKRSRPPRSPLIREFWAGRAPTRPSARQVSQALGPTTWSPFPRQLACGIAGVPSSHPGPNRPP